MGKTQSTETRGKADAVSYSPTGVQMRKQKSSKKSTDNRPTSYHGSVSAESSGNGIPVFNRFSTDLDLTGRPSKKSNEVANPILDTISEGSTGYFQQTANSEKLDSSSGVDRHSISTSQPKTPDSDPASNKVAEDWKISSTVQRNSVQEASVAIPSTSVRSTGDNMTQTENGEVFQHSSLAHSSFERALNQVILIWPKFEGLKSLDTSFFSLSMIGILQEVCAELTNEYKTNMSYKHQVQDQQRQLEMLVELERQSIAQEEKLRDRDAEIVRLNELVSTLRSAQADPGYTSGSDEIEERTRNSDHGQGHPRRLSDDRINLDDSARFQSRVKGKIYQATPLLQAEGEERSKMVVKRKLSLKPLDPEQRSTGHERSPPVVKDTGPLSPDADVEEKLKWLEKSLEREKQENVYLRDRVKSSSSESGQDAIFDVLPRRNLNLDDLVDRYRRLEEHAVGRLYALIKQHTKKVTNKRLSQFICTVMEASYVGSLSSVLSFTDAVNLLLANPFKISDPTTNSMLRANPALKAVKGQIKIFEASHSRPSHRSKESSDLIEMLVKQMTAYLQKMSDVTDLSPLTENVTEELRQTFSDCLSVSLLDQSAFSQFVNDCCRLAWQMAVVSPPLYISTESLRMDDRVHETLMQEQVTNAQVDFYLWPTLFERRNGTVLYKGRVVIKTI